MVQIWRLLIKDAEWRILKSLLTFEDIFLVNYLYFYVLVTGNRSHSGELSTACRSGVLKQICKSKWNILSRHHSGEFFIFLRSVDLEKDSIWWIVSMVQIWRLIFLKIRVKNIKIFITFWKYHSGELFILLCSGDWKQVSFWWIIYCM